MTKKRRKTLDDALAKQFVYGGDAHPDSEAVPKVEQPPADLKPEEIKNAPPDSEAAQPSIQNLCPPFEGGESKIPNKELSLMEKLQVQPKEVTKRFTVDLPETMHRKLSILAARTGRTKADIVRLLLQDALKDVED